MRDSQQRSGRRVVGHLARRPRLFHRPDKSADDLLRPRLHGDRPGMTRKARALRRGLMILLWTLPSMAIQGACLAAPGRGKVAFAMTYWRIVAWLLGIDVRVVGARASQSAGRPIVFVSNHSSWVDIPVIGGVLDGCFVAKGEVAGWPLIGTIARLGRTVFVSRQRGTTGRERDEMRDLLGRADNLILFPEGTSSDGSRVLPFRTSFFSIAEPKQGEDPRTAPLIQPVSVVYDRLGGLPLGRANRAVFAWYGDMDIASHYWRLAQHVGLRATVLLHPPVDPLTFQNRKEMSAAVWRIVADGASLLRQNRPVDAAVPARSVDVATGEQAYA